MGWYKRECTKEGAVRMSGCSNGACANGWLHVWIVVNSKVMQMVWRKFEVCTKQGVQKGVSQKMG